MIFLALIFYIVSMLGIPVLGNLNFLIAPVVLFGIAQALNIPTVQAMLATIAPMEHRAVFMSINGMVLRLGQTLGPIVTGLAYSFYGMNSPFILGAVLASTMLLLIPFLQKHKS